MKIGKHYTLEELTASQTAVRHSLDNTPGPVELAALKELVKHVLDPLREGIGAPVTVNSGYRGPAVNRKTGGATSSQHTLGQAADIVVKGKTVMQVCKKIIQLKLPFDQLIYEFGAWTHVSYGPRNRRQILTASKVNGKTVYTQGLPK